jgi:hypothetical protein
VGVVVLLKIFGIRLCLMCLNQQEIWCCKNEKEMAATRGELRPLPSARRALSIQASAWRRLSTCG